MCIYICVKYNTPLRVQQLCNCTFGYANMAFWFNRPWAWSDSLEWQQVRAQQTKGTHCNGRDNRLPWIFSYVYIYMYLFLQTADILYIYCMIQNMNMITSFIAYMCMLDRQPPASQDLADSEISSSSNKLTPPVTPKPKALPKALPMPCRHWCDGCHGQNIVFVP